MEESTIELGTIILERHRSTYQVRLEGMRPHEIPSASATLRFVASIERRWRLAEAESSGAPLLMQVNGSPAARQNRVIVPGHPVETTAAESAGSDLSEQVSSAVAAPAAGHQEADAVTSRSATLGTAAESPSASHPPGDAGSSHPVLVDKAPQTSHPVMPATPAVHPSMPLPAPPAVHPSMPLPAPPDSLTEISASSLRAESSAVAAGAAEQKATAIAAADAAAAAAEAAHKAAAAAEAAHKSPAAQTQKAPVPHSAPVPTHDAAPVAAVHHSPEPDPLLIISASSLRAESQATAAAAVTQKAAAVAAADTAAAATVAAHKAALPQAQHSDLPASSPPKIAQAVDASAAHQPHMEHPEASASKQAPISPASDLQHVGDAATTQHGPEQIEAQPDSTKTTVKSEHISAPPHPSTVLLTPLPAAQQVHTAESKHGSPIAQGHDHDLSAAQSASSHAPPVSGGTASAAPQSAHINLDDLREKILRTFARDMALEAERRGVSRWDL